MRTHEHLSPAQEEKRSQFKRVIETGLKLTALGATAVGTAGVLGYLHPEAVMWGASVAAGAILVDTQVVT